MNKQALIGLLILNVLAYAPSIVTEDDSVFDWLTRNSGTATEDGIQKETSAEKKARIKKEKQDKANQKEKKRHDVKNAQQLKNNKQKRTRFNNPFRERQPGTLDAFTYVAGQGNIKDSPANGHLDYRGRHDTKRNTSTW